VVDWNPYKLLQEFQERAISQAERTRLLQETDRYPYFALLHLLRAKADDSPDALFLASLYTGERKLLKKYLEGKLYLPHIHPPKVEPMPQSHLSSAPPQLFSILDFDQLESFHRDTDPNFYCRLPETPDLDYALESRLKESLLKHRSLGLKIREELDNYLQKDHSEALIDKFLKEPPKIRRRQPGYSDAVMAEDPGRESLEADQELVSETLAQLHLKQNNAGEAIRIYQKLRLRFPGKSAYFDAQIEKINIR
jgi:hypothetical protein